MMHQILAINPGSTSTKVALYADETLIFSDYIDHPVEILSQFDDILDQLDYRFEEIIVLLQKHHVSLEKLCAVVGRGGLLPPVHPGGYWVDQTMKSILMSRSLSPHASNLGALLADKIAAPLGIPSLIYDSVSSHEFPDIAMITGIPEYQRYSQCHVLNSKAMARKLAISIGKRYEDLNFIVAHLGGGVSISIHEKGKIVDSIGDDAGPFSPERAGGLPLMYVIEVCYSGKYTKKEMIRKIRGMGGLKAHLGTYDCQSIEDMIERGDQHAKLVYEAEAYQIAKGIGQLAPISSGAIDHIILTGGIAHSTMMTSLIRDRVQFIAPVSIMPGEMEMEALALGALRIVRGEESASTLPASHQEKSID